MPRTARKMSSTGYMHVIAKGNGGQILFEGPEDYRRYLFENNDKCLDCNLYFHSDNWAIKEIRSRFGVSSCTELQRYDKKARDDAIGVLKKAGLSVRQIERLTGLNRGIIQRAK